MDQNSVTLLVLVLELSFKFYTKNSMEIVSSLKGVIRSWIFMLNLKLATFLFFSFSTPEEDHRTHSLKKISSSRKVL